MPTTPCESGPQSDICAGSPRTAHATAPTTGEGAFRCAIPGGLGVERLWARTFARVEANEDVVVTAISANTLKIRPPSVEEREQHVAPLDRRLTKANSRLVLTNCRCAEGQHERLDVLPRMAVHQRFVETSRPILTTRPHVRRDQSQRHPVVARVGPQRLENGDRLFMLAAPVIRACEFPLREKRRQKTRFNRRLMMLSAVLKPSSVVSRDRDQM